MVFDEEPMKGRRMVSVYVVEVVASPTRLVDHGCYDCLQIPSSNDTIEIQNPDRRTQEAMRVLYVEFQPMLSCVQNPAGISATVYAERLGNGNSPS